MTRIALCFPGQGSQCAGMADGLLDGDAARPLLEEAALAGLDLEGLLRDGDDDDLRPTDVAQPALLLVETALAAAVAGSGVSVAAVAGHSVGEYAACVAAGALDPRAAMRLVIARGRAMAGMRDGAMLALLGAGPEEAEAVCAAVSASGAGTLAVANLNGPGQVVLSGAPGAIEAAMGLAREHGVRRAVRLNVSGAFHSPLMAGASDGLSALLAAAPLHPAEPPVVCNVDARAVRDADGLRARLQRQMTAPVRWADSVATLRAQGADHLVEVGPGAVLTGLARRIAPDVPALSVSTLEEAGSLPGRLGEPAS